MYTYDPRLLRILKTLAGTDTRVRLTWMWPVSTEPTVRIGYVVEVLAPESPFLYLKHYKKQYTQMPLHINRLARVERSRKNKDGEYDVLYEQLPYQATAAGLLDVSATLRQLLG